LGEDLGRLQTALTGHYTVERELGRGGMATVYLADDTRNHRRVAVKVLDSEYASVVARGRFLREIEIAANLTHPGIIPLFDSGVSEDLVYYVMPYVEGETLRDLLDREIQLPMDTVLRIAREVAEALAYAHARGVIHRDIKPANILLTEGHAQVADFGIARAVWAATGEQSTSKGIAVGTPQYMSPEQWAAGVVDRRTDVWALGCVVYEMLAGTAPFMGATPDAIRARAQGEGPPGLEVVRPGVGHAVQGVVERALAKVPADRWQSATEFAEALEAAAKAPESGPYPSPVPAPWWRTWRAGAAAAGVLVGLAGIVVPGLLGPRVDDAKIVVFPLQERGDTSISGAGVEVASLIVSELEMAESLKVFDAWTSLTSLQRRDPTLVLSEDVTRIARGLRARYALEGWVVRTGDTARVSVRLLDVRGDSLLPQVTQAGLFSPNFVSDLGLRAVSSLLSRFLQPGRRAEPALQDRNPAAVVAAVLGDLDYREARFDAAIAHYRRALELDSAMVLAAVKGASAANWDHRPDRALALARLGVRLSQRAPAKWRQFAVGLLAYLEDDPDSAAAAYHRAIALDSAWTEAWMALGEVHYHFIQGGWNPDSIAEAHFERARRLDPGFTPALYHLSEIAVRRGWGPRADSLYRAFRRAGPDGEWLRKLTWMVRCVRDGPDAVDWERAARGAGDASFDVMVVGHGLVKAQPACAERAFHAALRWSPPESLNNRWNALVGYQTLLVAQGRYREVRPLLAWGVDSVHRAAHTLQLVDAVVGVGTDSGAVAGLRDLGGEGADLRGQGPRWDWWHGIWAWHRRDAARLEQLVTWLADTMRVGMRDGLDTLVHGALATRLALLRADTLRAMELLSALEPRDDMGSIGWEFMGALPEERLLLSQLLLAKGRNAEALAVAGVFDSSQPLAYELYLPGSLVVRLRAAERLGRGDLAAEYRQRLRALGRQDLL